MRTRRGRRWLELCRDVALVSPGMFFVEYLVSGIYGVSLAATPLFLERVFDGVSAFAVGKISLEKMLLPILGLFGLMILSEIAAGASDYLGETYADLTSQKLFYQINRKIGKLSAIDFEKPQVLNQINKAYQGAFSSRDLVHTFMDLLTMYLPYFIFYGWYLYQCRPLLPLALVLIFVPVVLSQIVKGKLYAKQEDVSAPLRRKKDAFASYVSTKEYAKETRGHGAVPIFCRKFSSAQEELNKCLKKTETQICKADVIALMLNMAGYFGVLVLLLGSVLGGHIRVSAFVAVFSSIRTAYEQLEEIFGDRAGAISAATAKVKNYLAFLELPCEERGQTEEAPVCSIDAENVSFQYPDGTQALRGITFHAGRGQMIAVVGENGSGKTTLSKLLAGLYEPSAGKLLYNGQERKPPAIRLQTSQMFQQYNRYHMTLGQNIAIGRELRPAGEEAWAAIDGAGLPLTTDRFPDGLETMLGLTFGGIELSGGQWQRIALARAIYRPCQVLILDEPTAAIDPVEETALYRTFQECCRGRIGFVVTHRTGMVKICQQVIVMRQGSIVDCGTHEELLLRCEYYHRLWHAQADQYAC